MRLERYGIALDTLKSEHLEMVRLWRNQDFVRNNMQFKGVLSRTDQEKWFSRLDESNNLYWIIQYNHYPIGLIHIKEIDLDSGTGEAGIFIGEPSFLEMPQSMLAILFMMELAFYVLSLKTLKAKIQAGNHHSIRFNKQLGYSLKSDDESEFQYYTVNQNQFEEATEKLRQSAAKMYGNKTGVKLSSRDLNLHSKLGAIAVESGYFNPYFLVD